MARRRGRCRLWDRAEDERARQPPAPRCCLPVPASRSNIRQRPPAPRQVSMKVFFPSLLLLLLLLLLGVASPVPLLTHPVAKEVEADALCPEGWQEDMERSRCLVEIPRPGGLSPSIIRQLVHFCRHYQEGMLSFTEDGIACVKDLKAARRASPSQDELNERVMKRVFGNMGLGL